MAHSTYESEDFSTEIIGRPLPFEFSQRAASNRFLKASMTERLSTWDEENLEARGVPTERLINVYRKWGEGGFGVILTGNIMIEPDELEAAGNPIIPRTSPFHGERFEAFRKLAVESKKHGSLVLGQISHPGRQVVDAIQKHPISASDVQLQGNVFGRTFAKPRAATEEDIRKVIEGFAHGAEYLYKAGFDGIELHGAHGYLLAQFLSNATNKRTDKYGGTLENRARLITNIAEEIHKRVPRSFILAIKINSVEFQEHGFSPDECKELCALLETNEFDFVELSGGTYESLAFAHKKESTRKREAFFLDFAEVIVPALKKTKVYITGGLRSVGAMAKALDFVDGVGLGRPACGEFDFPLRVLAGKARGVIKPKLDEDDYASTSVAAGAQIRMVGDGFEPFDLSNPEHFAVFQGVCAKYFTRERGVGYPTVRV